MTAALRVLRGVWAAGRRRRRRGWARPPRVSRFWLRAGLWTAVMGGMVLAGRSALEHISGYPPLALAQLAPDAGVAPARPPSNKVKILFQTVPILKGQKVEIRWGKKRLGFIEGARKPFILERPRDSGPIDVVVKAEGFITVNTRAYTFDDNKVFVKLVPETERHTLLGYRVQLPDGGVDGGAGIPDGGLPPGGTPPMGPQPAPVDARPPPIPVPNQPLPAPTAPVPPPPAPPAPGPSP